QPSIENQIKVGQGSKRGSGDSIMSHNKRVTRLLTGASLAALSFLGARGSAAAATLHGTGNVFISTAVGTNPDFVNITAPANFGTVTNDTDISDGFPNPAFGTAANPAAVAVWVSTNASVQHFVNTANATIQAIEAG